MSLGNGKTLFLVSERWYVEMDRRDSHLDKQYIICVLTVSFSSTRVRLISAEI